jgi:hypothetical protein
VESLSVISVSISSSGSVAVSPSVEGGVSPKHVRSEARVLVLLLRVGKVAKGFRTASGLRWPYSETGLLMSMQTTDITQLVRLRRVIFYRSKVFIFNGSFV